MQHFLIKRKQASDVTRYIVLCNNVPLFIEASVLFYLAIGEYLGGVQDYMRYKVYG